MIESRNAGYKESMDIAPIITEAYGDYDPDEVRPAVLGVVRSADSLALFLPYSEAYADVYDDAFFTDNALVILGLQEGCGGLVPALTHLAVKDDTLYAEYHTVKPDYTADWEPFYYVISEVKQADVAAVKRTALWK